MHKDELRKYGSLRYQLKSIERRLQGLEKDKYSLQSQKLTDLPKANPTMDKEEMLLKICDKISSLQCRYNQMWDETIDKISEIEDVINSVEDIWQRTLLRNRYLNEMKWEEICTEMNYSWKQVHRIHNKALIELSDKCNEENMYQYAM